MSQFLTARLSAILLALGFFASQKLAAEVLPVLQTKTEAYEKVTVISQTKTHIFVQHSRGVANIKLSDLDVQALTALGFSSTDDAVIAAAGGDPAAAKALATPSQFSKFAASFSGMYTNFKDGLVPQASLPNLSAKAAYAILGGFVVAYLFFCYCSMLICKRTANKPGVWVWLPVVQLFPLLRAAGMSRWWFMSVIFLFSLPVAYVLWSVKIARACGKGVGVAILLILPVTNVFTYMYLAFSGRGKASKDDLTGVKQDEMEPLPA